MKRLTKIMLTVIATLAVLLVLSPVVKADGPVSVTTSGIAIGNIPAGNIKLNGRTSYNGTKLYADYSATGFTLNVTASASTTFKVTYSTSYSNKISIWIDGSCALMSSSFSAGENLSSSVSLPKGTHEVQVVKESQISSSKTGYFTFDTVSFAGTINAKPADKNLFIEFIGDSITCGDGAVGKYEPAVKWSEPRDDAASSSFAWYAAKMLDADYSFVSRGGIGLDGADSQQETQTITSPMVYDYASYRDYGNGTKYDFSAHRTPDLIVIKLGANDSKTASNEEKWGLLAKNFILQVKADNGDVPILWLHASGAGRFYRQIQNLIDNDPDLAVYDNLYNEMSFSDKNGSAALATQTGGHPDAEDQYALGERVVQMITTEDMLHKEPVYETERVLYVSEYGDDSNSGETPETSLKTISKAVGKIPTSGNANGLTVHIYVTGSVTAATSQNFAGIGDTRKTHSDGSLVEFVVETLDYDPALDNRAELVDTYTPGNTGQLVLAFTQPFTLKNVKLYGKNYMKDSTKYAVNKLYAAGNTVVLDNVTFGNVADTKWLLSAADYTLHGYMKDCIDNGTEIESTLILKNGRFGDADGVDRAVAVSGSSIWASDANGGSRPVAKGLICRVVIGYGAVVSNDNIYMLNKAYSDTSGLIVKEAIVEVAGGGVITGGYTGMRAGTSTAKMNELANTKITLFVNGGTITGGPVAMFGNYNNFTGDVCFRMTGGHIFVPSGTSTQTSSAYLTGSRTAMTITGNQYVDISGGNIYMSGNNTSYTNNIAFGGYNITTTGIQHNVVTGGSFFWTGSMASASSIYMASISTDIQTELINEIYGGVFDNTLGSAGSYYFTGQGVHTAVKKYTCTVGVKTEDGRNVGPYFVTNSVNMAGGWGQIGRGKYSNTAAPSTQEPTDDIVLDVTINGGHFGGNVNTTTSSSTLVSSNYYPMVLGSTHIVINNGCFEGNVNLTNAAPIYGHAYAEINGGLFSTITPIASTSTNGLIQDGLEILIRDANNMRKVKSKEYTFYGLNTGTLSAVTPGRAAFDLTIEKGIFSNLALNKRSETVIGDIKIDIKGGQFTSVTSDMATGFLEGGYFIESPDSSLAKEGYGIVASTSYPEYPYQIGKAHKNHCVCGTGEWNGVGTHVCDDSTEWTDLNAFLNDHKAEITNGTRLGAVITSGNYYLSGDLQLPYQWFVSVDSTVPSSGPRDIYLCLNGYTLKAAKGSRLFCFNCGTEENPCGLHISDCSEEQTGLMTGASTSTSGGSMLFNNYNATLDLFGGTLEGGIAQRSGGNIAAMSKVSVNIYGATVKDGTSGTGKESAKYGGNIYSEGTVNLYGGTVTEGFSNASGGNIYMSGTGTLNLFDGTVKGGESTTVGGNVYVNGLAKLNMDGGTVKGGTSGTIGGNVYLDGTLTMTDGVITEGYAGSNAGNMYVSASGEAFLQGGEISKGNGNYGGNLRINGTVTMEGDCVISEGYCRKINNDGGHGGNIYLSSGTLNLVSGTIADGECESIMGSNISMNNSQSVFNMSGGLITGGKGAERSLAIWNSPTATANISGGIIEDSPVGVYLGKGTLNMTGGYFEAPVKADTSTLTDSTVTFGGTPYFREMLQDKVLGSVYFMKTLNPTVTDTEGNEYFYTIGAGVPVYTTSTVYTGTQISVAAVIGGGYKEFNQDFTLSAPAEANGYSFMAWLDEDGNILSEDPVYTVVGGVTESRTYTACYEFRQNNLTLTVVAEAFTVSETDGDFTDTAFGTKTYTFAPGTKLTLHFDDEPTFFTAWENTSNKIYSRDVEYTFTLWLSDTITGVSNNFAEAKREVVIINEFSQVLRHYFVTAEGFTKDQVLTVPTRDGSLFKEYEISYYENGVKKSTKAADADALVTAVNGLPTAVDYVTVTYVFEPDPDAEDYTVTVQNMKVKNDFLATTVNDWTALGSDTTYTSKSGELTVLNAKGFPGLKLVGFMRKVDKGHAEFYSAAETTYYVGTKGRAETLYAVYSEDTDPLLSVTSAVSGVTVLDQGDGKATVSISTVHSVPDDFTIVERGILFTNDSILEASGVEGNLINAKESMVYSSSYKFRSKDTVTKSASTTLNIKNISVSTLGDTTFYARGYVIYQDDIGLQGILYSGVTAGTVNGGFKIFPEKNVLDGKRVIFIGNSYIYYGQTTEYVSATVYNMGPRTGDRGYFYRMAENNGAQTEVVNWIWGSHLAPDFFGNEVCKRKDTCKNNSANHYEDLLKGDLYFDYVVFQDCGREGLPGYEDWLDYVEICADTFKNVNPNVELYYFINAAAYGYNVFKESASLPEVPAHREDIEALGYTVVDWGKPVTDLADGRAALSGTTYTYEPYTFFVASDGAHENLLSGYITTLMLYCTITGENPEWQTSEFVFDNQANVGRLLTVESFLSNYYSGAETNMDEILADDAEMDRIRAFIATYMD